MFLDQLIRTLEIEQTRHPLRSRKVSGPSGGGKAVVRRVTRKTAVYREMRTRTPKRA